MAQINFQNRTLYHRDNLEILRGINTETVHLIATDPPFNKNRDFHATPDSLARDARFQDRWSWRDDVHDDWLLEIMREHPDVWSVISAAKRVYGDDMGAFLCFMAVRLLEMHRILRDDGSLYLHIDHTAHAYVKCLLDAIFGRQNFRNDIVWKRTTRGFKGSQFLPRNYNSNTDSILYYVKSDEALFDMSRVLEPYDPDYLAKAFKLEDDAGSYYLDVAFNRPSASPRPNLCYEYKGFYPPHASGWKVGKTRMEELDKAGELVVKNDQLYRKVRPKEGRIRNNLWDDVSEAKGKERSGYPTQKPLALYERIIKASSNPGDFVLDPFCGCATTPIAAERLGRKWVGIDIWDKAHETVLARLKSEGLMADESGAPDNTRLNLNFKVHYETKPPIRTDGGDEAVAILATPTSRVRKRYPPPRSQHERLLLDFGAFCQGCGRDYSFDPRVLEVDHIRPKSDGGTDAYGNLTLLCPPCNRAKLDRMTLTGLQEQNRKEGHLLPENEKNIKLGRRPRIRSNRKRRR